jgi:AbiU2
MIKVANSAEFKRLLETLALDITTAAICYRQFRALLTALVNNPDVENNARTFWSLTLEGTLTMCLQALCRAYDQEKSGLHLHSLLRTIENNLHLFDEPHFKNRLKGNAFVDSLAAGLEAPESTMLKIDIYACSSNDPLVKTLQVHRNNRIAHRSAKNVVTGYSINSMHPLGYDEIETLIDRAVTILNRYSSMFDSNTYSTSMIGEDDYEFVIQSLKAEITATKVRSGILETET